MARFGSNAVGMDVSFSPSLSLHCQKNFSPSAPFKTIYSHIISCQRSETCSATPDGENNSNKMASPFVEKRVPFNPFNYNLKERLEQPVFSPGVFSTVRSPSQDSQEFKWTIDDLSKINPVHIEEEFQFEEQTDEKTESEIQRSIDKYFTQTHMVKSPWDCRLPTSWQSLTEIFKKENKNVLTNETNQTEALPSPYSFSLSRLELFSKTPSQNASTQTDLSLPPDLPENVSFVLKPYFLENELDDINLSINSLRRKLFFQAEDDLLSPVQYFNVKEDSPLISGDPATPMIPSRSEDPSVARLSPLDLSPICRMNENLACNNASGAMQIPSLTETEGRNALAQNGSVVSQHHGEECFKVFESPKLIGGIRRNRKRRRSLSQATKTSISNSSFSTKLKEKQAIHKMPSCGKIKSFVDENVIASHDTGYLSESANLEKLYNSDVKHPSFEYWKGKNKENFMFASTPTK